MTEVEFAHMSKTNVRAVDIAKSGEGYRAAMRVLGVVATLAGTRGLLVGSREVPDPGAVTASVDSEYRFYAAWYPVLGITILRGARQPVIDAAMVRAVAAGLGLAAAGRALSIRALGRPARSQMVLLGIEAVLSGALVPLHRRAFPTR